MALILFALLIGLSACNAPQDESIAEVEGYAVEEETAPQADVSADASAFSYIPEKMKSHLG